MVLGAALVAAATQACTPKSKDEAGPTRSESALGETTSTVGSGLVISQIYGGAGTRGAPMNRAYVELFNRTREPIPLQGLSIHYAGPISEFGLAGHLPQDAVIPPGGYYLVGFIAGQAGLDVRPDAAGLSVSILPVNGKVALVKTLVEDSGDAQAQKMGCGSADAGTCVGNARVLDVVGYGVTTDHEGPTTADPPTFKTALYRKGDGCIDTGSNNDDFEVGEPKPRTAASPVHVCEGTP
ncbi:MAG: lamin tail domain-containing protein [Labilithrix sp.]|nr:lamin tail domain-containing protein [Labilithrix sp.]